MTKLLVGHNFSRAKLLGKLNLVPRAIFRFSYPGPFFAFRHSDGAQKFSPRASRGKRPWVRGGGGLSHFCPTKFCVIRYRRLLTEGAWFMYMRDILGENKWKTARKPQNFKNISCASFQLSWNLFTKKDKWNLCVSKHLHLIFLKEVEK